MRPGGYSREPQALRVRRVYRGLGGASTPCSCVHAYGLLFRRRDERGVAIYCRGNAPFPVDKRMPESLIERDTQTGQTDRAVRGAYRYLASSSHRTSSVLI